MFAEDTDVTEKVEKKTHSNPSYDLITLDKWLSYYTLTKKTLKPRVLCLVLPIFQIAFTIQKIKDIKFLRIPTLVWLLITN